MIVDSLLCLTIACPFSQLVWLLMTVDFLFLLLLLLLHSPTGFDLTIDEPDLDEHVKSKLDGVYTLHSAKKKDPKGGITLCNGFPVFYCKEKQMAAYVIDIFAGIYSSCKVQYFTHSPPPTHLLTHVHAHRQKKCTQPGTTCSGLYLTQIRQT